MSSATLYHFALDPASRLARLALGEAKVAVEEVLVRPWEPDCPIHAWNPTGMPPVLKVAQVGKPLILCETSAILGWIEDRSRSPVLLPSEPEERAEARRLVAWFERRFSDEVNAILLHERMEKPLLRLGPPDARLLREGRAALKGYLVQMEEMLQTRDRLAGRSFSIADLTAAAHLSALDFFGEVPWGTYPALKTWYMSIKSRPAFRTLLTDRFPGVTPSGHYADLDF